MESNVGINELYVTRDLVSSPKAVVLLTHGLAEHLHRYDDWVQDLNRSHISVFRYDFPGHGRSRKKEWLFRDFRKLTDALFTRYQTASQYAKEQEIPLFLFGHSLGGLTTAGFVSGYQPEAAGVILSAPSLDPGDMVSPFLIRIARVARYVLPGLPVMKLPPKLVSEDPQVVVSYESDPLVYQGKIKVRTGYEILKRMQEVIQDVKNFHLPVLMLQGEEDQIVRPEETKSYFDKIPVEDKTFVMYEGVFHEILNSTKKEKAKKDILEWIQARS